MGSIKEIPEFKISFFQEEVLAWYFKMGRKFPWRKKSATTYELIIAEIFLQRTKAETIAKFLPRFLSLYPSWKRLSLATELDLQEALKPIGLYKQRGERLFQLAQEMSKSHGRFPNNRKEILSLPMMGQYITNAYELYVLGNKSPLLDVNMARLLERFFGDRDLSDIRYDPYLQSLAYKVVEVNKSKELNWGILDYAALICRKSQPECDHCTLALHCHFYKLTEP